MNAWVSNPSSNNSMTLFASDINMLLNAAVILSLALDWFIREKRRNLYLSPSYSLRLLALPYYSWTATKKPYACICNRYVRPYIPRGISCRMQDNYISTGIHRCSILDCNTKFCENFREPRISADKRFSLCLLPALVSATGGWLSQASPLPTAVSAVCNRKGNKIS